MQNSPTEQEAEKRRRAEELLHTRLQGPIESETHKSLEDVLHELAVHQIELEMQNEELRRTEDRLETARKKYSDLYNFAPVGYFSFDSKGKILEANLAGARMLGVERGSLVGKVFTEFCAKTSADQFYLHLRRVFKSKETEKCELAMDMRKKATARTPGRPDSMPIYPNRWTWKLCANCWTSLPPGQADPHSASGGLRPLRTQMQPPSRYISTGWRLLKFQE